MKFQGWSTWVTQNQDSFPPSVGRPYLVRQNWLCAILFHCLVIWCRACSPSRGNGREELPRVSFAEGFLFAKLWNSLRGKKILHHLICKLRKGSTQYLCSRGNETHLEKHKRPLESHSLILCSCRHQAQNDIQNTHKSSAFAWKGDRNYYNVALKKKEKINDSFSVAKRNVIYE